MEYMQTSVEQTANICSTCKGTGIKLIGGGVEYGCDVCSRTGLSELVIKRFEGAATNSILLEKVLACMTSLAGDLNDWRNDFMSDVGDKKSIDSNLINSKMKEFNKIFVDVYDVMTAIE